MCESPCNPVREAIEEHRKLLAEKFGVVVTQDDRQRGSGIEVLHMLETGHETDAHHQMSDEIDLYATDLNKPIPQAFIKALVWLDQHAPSRAAETIKHALTIK